VHARAQGIAAGALARVTRRALACMLLASAAFAGTAQARDPITPLSDIHRGLHCTALTVVQGTDIASFDVDVLDVLADAGGTGARILVHVSGPAVDATGLAEGFSGSPVYCPDANGVVGNAGAISATVGQYGEDVGLVTPIEQMLGLRVHPPSSVRIAPKLLRGARPLATPLVVSGLAPSLGQWVERVGAAHGRTVLATASGPLGAFPPQPLVPGASVSVLQSSGAVVAGGVGTVTYRDGATVYAFGHPMDSAGRRALMLGDAYVFTVIGNPIGLPPLASYKLAAPGHVLGTLSNDASDGIVGTVGASSPTIPVTATVRDRDRHRTLRQRTAVADETDVGNPTGSSGLSEIAPLAVAQAVTSAFDGAPGLETGQLCLHVSIRELHGRTLRFCKRYVASGAVDPSVPPPLGLLMANDVSRAIGEIDAARFGLLHVTGLTAGATIERGLRLGTILDVRGPRTVHPGHTARIALLVRVVRGPLMTIHVKLAIPRDVPHGTQTIRLVGTPVEGTDGGDTGSGALAALLSVFGGEGDSGPGDAQSPAELVSAFDALGGYDGVTARMRGDEWQAYRDPRMRLDGRALLQVRVAGRGRHRAAPTTTP
jgi:hypothetical protein